MTALPLHHHIAGPTAADRDDAPVLVLGSSLGTTGAMWDPQMAALTGRFRVVRFDHRGHGGSPAVPGPYRLDDLGGDVLALLDRLGVQRCRYAGLSLGGMVGMWLAAHAPERVGRLALLCTSAYLPPADAWTGRAATVRAEGTKALAEMTIGRWFTPEFPRRRPEIVAGIIGELGEAVDDEGYAGCCEAIASMDLRPVLGAIGAPTLVIAGAGDPATPPHHAETIAAGIAGARVAVVDDAAHLANVEQPEAVTRLLLDHLCEDPA